MSRGLMRREIARRANNGRNIRSFIIAEHKTNVNTTSEVFIVQQTCRKRN